MTVRRCKKCGLIITEYQTSHDVPKYIGGTDLDGRSMLCKDCHFKYDNMILSNIYIKHHKRLVKYPKNHHERTVAMMKLKLADDKLKREYRETAKEVKKRFFK